MWIIKNKQPDDEPEYWSNRGGWGDKDSADQFTTFQKDTGIATLPMEGKWVKYCTHGSVSVINEKIIEYNVEKSVLIEVEEKCNHCDEIVAVERQLFKFEYVDFQKSV